MATSVQPQQQPQPATSIRPATTPLAPAPPSIAVVRGEAYPTTEAEAGKKSAWVKQLIANTDAEHLGRCRKAAFNLLQSHGRQYLAWSGRGKFWDDLPLDPNEVRVVMNYIRPILRARTRRLLPSRIDYQITPDSSSADARDSAVVGERFLAAMYQRLGLHEMIDQALELAYCSGLAFLQPFWNPTTGPAQPATLYVDIPQTDEAGQPVLDEATGQPVTTQELAYVNAQGEPVESEADAFWFRPGDVDCAIRSVFNVRWNPEAKGFTAGKGLRWLIDMEPLPVSDVRLQFPEYAEKIQPSASSDTYLTYERLGAAASQGRTQTAKPGASAIGLDGATCMVTRYWELPSPYFPDGRLITMAGDCVVFDGAWPTAGVLPYIPVFDEPAPLTAGGRPCVDDMVGPQGVINEQWGAILRSSKSVGVGQFVTITAPGMPDRVTNEDGAIITLPSRVVAGRRIDDVFKKLDPSSVPSDRWNIIQEAQSALYNVGSYHEVSRGQTPPGVDSGIAIRSLLEQEEGQMAKSIAALRASLVELGRQLLALARWGYQPGDPRWIPVDRPDLGYQIESVDGAKLPDPERVLLSLDGFRATSEAEQRAEIKEAVGLGMLTPQEARRSLDLKRGVSSLMDSESRHYARARQINLWIEQGAVQVTPVLDQGQQPMEDPRMPGMPLMQTLTPSGLPAVNPEVDQHEVHLMVLEELILDETKAPPVRATAQHIYSERVEILRGRAMAAQPAPNAAAPVS
jgi:hypothetical protein